MTRAAIVFIVGLLAACGGGSATSPSPTVQPASIRPVLGEEAATELTAEGWRLTFKATNQGPGCAVGVAGTTTFRDAGNATVVILTWALDVGRVVGVGETFDYATCCLDQEQAQVAATASTAFRWTNAVCP